MKLILRNSIEKRDGAGRFDVLDNASPLHIVVLGTREQAESVVVAVNEREELVEALEAMVDAAYGVASESMNRARKQARAVLDRAKESET